jgi:exonuclease V gamma subunit
MMMNGDAATKFAVDAASELVKSVIGYWMKRREEKVAQVNEVEALTAALSIELASLVEAVINRRKWWLSEDGKDKWLPPLLPFYVQIYDQVKDRIQKLPPDLVAATVHFHGYLRFANGMHEVRKDYEKAGKRKQFHEIYEGTLQNLTSIGLESLEVFNRYAKPGTLRT